MKETWQDRTKLLIGSEAIEKLQNSKIIIYGIGGVGSFVVEGLTRVGVGHLVLVDQDTISISNLNRQIHATHSTLGRKKVEVMKERILSINPSALVETYMANELTFSEEELIDSTFSYVIDAVDTVTTKLKIIQKAYEKNIPVLSCMGTGNKLKPQKLEISTISKTSVCPLAKVMRKELSKKGIQNVKVLYSKEEPQKLKQEIKQEGSHKLTPGSISFVPSVAGLMIAGEAICDLIGSHSEIQEKENNIENRN